MKLRNSLTSLCCILVACSLLLTFNVAAQQPQPAPTQSQAAAQDDDEVVRITSNLVQVDAVFLDRAGKLVTDIRPEEVEILENGKPQAITNFSFVSLAPETAARANAPTPAPANRTAAPVPPVRLRPEQVRRTVALVVDDLGLSFESTHFVRRALRKFVDEQMQAGDLVAIIRTGGGMGALQQFTSNKQQLYAAIERVRWNPSGRGRVNAFAPIAADPLARAEAQNSSTRGGPARNAGESRNAIEDLEQFREDLFAVGTLGALNFVVRGLRELPGRKSVVLLSDGFRIFNRDNTEQTRRTLDALQRLTDLANRASVVIYTIDARGLATTGLTAADSVSGMSEQEVRQSLAERAEELFETQGALNYLARQTGGFGVRNTNDISRGVERVLEDQSGYYLIAYRPDDATFDQQTGRRRFNRLELRVKRPGVRYRTRTGFYGFTDEETRRERPRTRDEQLLSAITSPFSTGGVRLRLTSFFGNVEQGSYVRSWLYIDANDLTFTRQPDGTHTSTIDVVAITFGDNGQIVDQVGRTHSLTLSEAGYRLALRDGILYNMTVPVKKPGAYQLRTALRDTATERVGSASQFVEVPDVNKNRLTLSSVVVNGIDPAAASTAAGQTPSTAGDAAATASGAADGEDPQASPAVRRFRSGMVMQIGYQIYNAQLDKTTRQPRVETQVRLFRDGQELFAGRSSPLAVEGQTDLKRLRAGSVLRLGAQMPPGEYVLQVVVTDTLAKEKQRTATQWIDFEIVK
jgi:VWFA-related protein